jgi:HipA-like C-terminal domain
MERAPGKHSAVLQQALLTTLEARGVATAAQLQAAIRKSQPTVSRLLKALGGEVVALGRGRSTRYGVGRPILGTRLGQQPIWWHDIHGGVQPWGRLTWLAQQQIHVQTETGQKEWLLTNKLPWFLAPLRMEGYLGRLAARTSYLARVLDSDPQGWSVEQQLYAAIAQTHDGPGAMTLGDPEGGPSSRKPVPFDDEERRLRYDLIASDVAGHLNPGSSAGGEQAKFLATRSASVEGPKHWEHLIVKFSPPHDTPFGARWRDLLHAEATALSVLAKAGEPAARCRVLESPTRTYLESERFDRVGHRGRRHAVPLAAVHEAFVHLPMKDWVRTTEALHAQHRLNAEDVRRVRLWHAFGRLICNTDMHFGNLSLWADDPSNERFALAPCYDMLPMAYKPDAHEFSMAPREPDQTALRDPLVGAQATQLAQQFWQQVAGRKGSHPAFRQMAAENARRLMAVDLQA